MNCFVEVDGVAWGCDKPLLGSVRCFAAILTVVLAVLSVDVRATAESLCIVGADIACAVWMDATPASAKPKLPVIMFLAEDPERFLREWHKGIQAESV